MTGPFEVDVLIVGGGVQGLWALKELKRSGFSVILLDRGPLGGEQTCHSHVYIHGGHLYRELPALGNPLKEAAATWRRWLDAQPLVPWESENSTFGFSSAAHARSAAELWEAMGIPFEKASIPAPFQHGNTTDMFTTPAPCLNATWLVEALLRESGTCAGRISAVEEIGSKGEAVTEVRFLSPFGERMAIQPRALVLCAGAGNQHLIHGLTGAQHMPAADSRAPLQTIRKGFMLVVEGDEHVLPPVTGIFSPSGLFIVSRTRQGRTVWLVSDARSPSVVSAEDYLLTDLHSWLPEVLAGLHALAPGALDLPEALSWAAYEAPKAETPDRDPFIGKVGGFANCWVLWPTKLTLAPWLAKKLLNRIFVAIGRPIGREPLGWAAARTPPVVGAERWTTLPLQSWETFRLRYDIEMSD